MENRTDKPVTIDRDAIGLKLADGSVIPRRPGRGGHKSYVLGPHEGRDVHVDFRLGGRQAYVDEAALVIDGVTVGDEEPRELGEVALSSRHAIRKNIAKQTAAENEAIKAEQEAEDAEAAAPAEEPTDVEAPSADEEEAPDTAGEDWQIGH